MESLRKVFRAVSPMVYFDKFSRWPRKSMIIYAKYDLTFLPEFSDKWLPNSPVIIWITRSSRCPVDTFAWESFPYNYMDGWHLASFSHCI